MRCKSIQQIKDEIQSHDAIRPEWGSKPWERWAGKKNMLKFELECAEADERQGWHVLGHNVVIKSVNTKKPREPQPTKSIQEFLKEGLSTIKDMSNPDISINLYRRLRKRYNRIKQSISARGGSPDALGMPDPPPPPSVGATGRPRKPLEEILDTEYLRLLKYEAIDRHGPNARSSRSRVGFLMKQTGITRQQLEAKHGLFS